MKKVIVLTKLFILNILCWPLMAISQDSIVVEEDPAVFDSTLLTQQFEFGEGATKSSGPDYSLVIIVAVLTVISAIIYFILKKRKK